MSAVLRSLTVMAMAATFARPLSAQRTPAAPQQPAPAAPTPTVPALPGGGPPSGRDFGDAMGAWGESLGQSLGVLGDSLGRLGSALATAETDEATHASARNKARVDSIQHAMRDVERTMGYGHVHGRDWRDFARQARDAGMKARDEARKARDAAAQARGASSAGTSSIRDLVERVRRDPEAIAMPPVDSFVSGALTIAAGMQRQTTAATAHGNLDVYGTIAGNAIAVDGNVEIHPGGHVTGSAFAAGGEVHVDSAGLVDGEIRSLTGDFGPIPGTSVHVMSATSSRWHALRLALMGYALVMMLGIGVLTFAEEQLDHVTATLADNFGRAAWYGVVGEIAFGPAFAVMCLALAVTIIGILAIPFATVGYFAIGIGAAALGFMGVAEATGTAVLRSQTQASLTPRGAQLRAIVIGISIYGGLWVLTALVGAESAPGVAIRAIATVVTGVAVTVGFGAVLVWRVDVRRARRVVKTAAGTPIDDAAWQTPTPVAGVAAARRAPPVGQTSEKQS
jgi:hypothetical protein